MENKFESLNTKIVKNYQNKTNSFYIAAIIAIGGLILDIISGLINRQMHHVPSFLIFVGPYRYIIAGIMMLAIMVSFYALIDIPGNRYRNQIDNDTDLKLKTIQYLNKLYDNIQETNHSIDKLKYLIQNNQVEKSNINSTINKIEKLETKATHLITNQKAYESIAYDLYQYSKFSV